MRIVVILCLVILFSCRSKTAVPDGIIPVKEMTNVLWDVMMADELVMQQYPVDTVNKRFDTSIVLYQQIAQAHNTTQQQFKKSLQFYQSRPELLQIILDSLQQRTTVPLPSAKDTLAVKAL
jgi:hypothetical protein